MAASLVDTVAAERVGILGRISVAEILALMPPRWIDYATWPSIAGVSATVGAVSGVTRVHTKDGVTVHRFIPTPYNEASDAFYSDAELTVRLDSRG